MSEILWITPVFKEMIWGGERLSSVFHYEIPSDHTGECWAISAHPNGDCVIASGVYQGQTLSRLWEEHRELFGNCGGDRFPLLTKIIDAREDLSIQVHPDDAYAAVHENGSLGKTECWYVLDCDEDARIVIGHHARNHEEMEQMILEKRWEDFIRVIPVKKGDFFHINPGCLHAIKGGTLILETQQNSDITYRVYDYDRLSEGKLRPLHVQQSIDTITAPYVETENRFETVVYPGEDGGSAVRTRFISCSYYTVDKYEVAGLFVSDFGKVPFVNVSITDGEGSVNGQSVKKGTHLILPYGYGACEWKGNFTMICASPSVGGK